MWCNLQTNYQNFHYNFNREKTFLDTFCFIRLHTTYSPSLSLLETPAKHVYQLISFKNLALSLLYPYGALSICKRLEK